MQAGHVSRMGGSGSQLGNSLTSGISQMRAVKEVEGPNRGCL